MKKLIGPLAILLVVALTILNSIVVINPGNVGVLVHRTGGGVDPTPLEVGFHFKYPVLEDIIEYPVYMQTLVLTRTNTEGTEYNDEINVNSIEGQPISCDVSLSFEIDPQKVPFLYSSFRSSINLITHGFVKQTIRQVMQEIVGHTEIVNFLGKDKAAVVTAIQEDLQKRLGQYGFVIKQFTMNEIRAPESIVTAIEAKNTMAQDALRAQNELQKIQFESQQKVIQADGDAKATLTRAQSQAESNRLLAESITPTLVEYRRIEKWDGVMPQVMGSANPFVTLKGNPTPAEMQAQPNQAKPQ